MSRDKVNCACRLSVCNCIGLNNFPFMGLSCRILHTTTGTYIVQMQRIYNILYTCVIHAIEMFTRELVNIYTTFQYEYMSECVCVCVWQ